MLSQPPIFYDAHQMLNDMIVSMSRWPYLKGACFFSCDAQTFSSISLSFLLFLRPASARQSACSQGVPSFVFMYIHHPGGNLYLRHHHGARQGVVSGASSFGSAAVPASTTTPATSSDPSQTQLQTSSKSLIGICAVVGTCLLGSFTSTGP